MKYYVSLLPLEYRQERSRLRKLKTLRLLLSALCIALLVPMLVTAMLRIAKEKELTSVQEYNRQASSQIEDLSRYKVIKEELDLIEQKIASAHTSDPEWIAAIAKTANALPGGVGLRSLNTSVSSSNQSYVMELDCVASQYESVAQTILALEECEIIKSVSCNESSEDNLGVRFTLTVELLPVSQR